MMKSLDEAINRFEKLASDYEFNLNMHKNHVMNLSVNDIERMQGHLEEHRQLAEWLRELKRDRKILDGLSIYFQSLVVDAVINQRPLMFDMRDATEEERESVKRYIADSTSTTGVNFWSLIGEVNADGSSN